MKNILLFLVGLFATPQLAHAEQYGDFSVDKTKSVCVMAIDRANGSFALTLDSLMRINLVATRPATMVRDGMVDAEINFDKTSLPVVGMGAHDAANGGVAIPIGDGLAVLRVFGSISEMTISAEGVPIATLIVDDGFREAVIATIRCAVTLDAPRPTYLVREPFNY